MWALQPTGSFRFVRLPGQPLDAAAGSGGAPIPRGSLVSLVCEYTVKDECPLIRNATLVSSPAPVGSTLGATLRPLVVVTGVAGGATCNASAGASQIAVRSAFTTNDFNRAYQMALCSYGNMTYDTAGLQVTGISLPCGSGVDVCDPFGIANRVKSQYSTDKLSSFNQLVIVLPNQNGCANPAFTTTPGNVMWLAPDVTGVFSRPATMRATLQGFGLYRSWKDGKLGTDPYSPMGSGPVCPSAPELFRLGWATPAASLDSVSLPDSGVYYEYGLRASYLTGEGSFIRIRPDWMGADYRSNLYLALRQKGGGDGLLDSVLSDKIVIHSVDAAADDVSPYPRDPRVTFVGTLAAGEVITLPRQRLSIRANRPYGSAATTATLAVCRYESQASECPSAPPPPPFPPPPDGALLEPVAFLSSMLDGFATISSMSLTDMSASGFSGSLAISIPDLGLTGAACTLAYDALTVTFSFQITGSAKLYFDALVLRSLSLTVARDSVLWGSATGSLASYSVSTAFSFSLPSAANVKAALRNLSVSLPSMSLRGVLGALIDSTATDALPAYLLETELPAARLSTKNISTGVLNLVTDQTGSSPLLDVLFDKDGVLVCSATFPPALDIGGVLGSLGLRLPVDPSTLPSLNVADGSVILTYVSNRTDLNVTDAYGKAVQAAGTYLTSHVGIPALGVASTLAELMVQDARGQIVPSLEFQITSKVPVAGGLIGISDLALLVDGRVGLQGRCTADFLGVAMAGSLNISAQGHLASSIKSTGSSVNLAAVFRDDRMWSSAPLVADLLGRVEFPAFSVDMSAGTFYGTAGPASGLALSFAVDGSGLRYAKVETDSSICVSLGQMVNGLGLGFVVPDGLFSICGPSLEYVPAYAGPPFTLRNGTSLAPFGAVGFRLSLPDMGIDHAAAYMSFADAAGQAPTSFSLRVAETITMFNGFATISSMSLTDMSASGFSASLAISIPDLGLTGAACDFAYNATSRTYSLQITGSAKLYFDSLVFQSLSLTVARDDAFLWGSASGLLASYSVNTTFSFSLPSATNAKAALRSFAVSLPSVALRDVLGMLGPSASDSLPALLLDIQLPAVQLSTVGTLSEGVFRVNTRTSTVSLDVLFDRKGVLATNAAFEQGLNIDSALAQLGVQIPLGASQLPQANDLTLSYVSNRTDVNITAYYGEGLLDAGTYLSCDLSIPALGASSLPFALMVQDALGRFAPSFAFRSKGKLSMANGLLTVSDLALEVASGVGLYGACTADFLGVTMAGSVNVSTQGTSSSALAAPSGVNLTRVVLNPRMWPSAPSLVTGVLSPLTFPSFTLASTAGTYYAVAGPTVNGVALSFVLDGFGLRYAKLDTAASYCLSLGQLVAGVGLKFSVPNLFTVCQPYLEYAPATSGPSTFTLSNGANLVAPFASAGFVLSMPDLGIDKVAAALSFVGAGGAAPASFNMRVTGPVSIYNGFATISSMSITTMSASGFSASLAISIPDLGLSGAACTLAYDAVKGRYTFLITGDAQLLLEPLVLKSLSLTVTRGQQSSTLQGSASGFIGSYSVTTSFNLSLPAVPGGKAVLYGFSVSMPSAKLIDVLSVLGPSEADVLPSFLTGLSLPAVQITSTATSGVYKVAAQEPSWLNLDIMLDKGGVLVANAAFKNGLTLSDGLISALGLELPFDPSDILSVSFKSLSFISNRTDVNITALYGAVLRPVGTYLASTVGVPVLGISSVPSDTMIRDAQGRLVPSFQFQISNVSLPGGLITLANLSLALDNAASLRGSCSGTFVGVGMSGSLNIPNNATDTRNPLSMSLTAAGNVNMTRVITDPRMWPNAPPIVTQLLRPVVFPAFTINASAGAYYGKAGPASNGVVLNFAVDGVGLRYVKLESKSSFCLGLSDLVKGVGLGFTVPANLFSVCSPFLEYVQPYPGSSPTFTLSNGTALSPFGATGFVVTMSDLGIDRVAASLSFASDTGGKPSTFNMQIRGPFSILNDWATIMAMSISNVSSSGFTASAIISVPYLSMTNAVCTLVHNATARSYTFQINGSATLVFNSLVLRALSLKVDRKSPGTVLQGSATGSLGNYTASTSFSLSLPSNATAKATLQSFAVAVPSAMLTDITAVISPSISATIPKFLRDVKLPSLNLSMAQGVYSIETAALPSGVSVDMLLDGNGTLAGTLAMSQSLDLGAAISEALTMADPRVDRYGAITYSSPNTSAVSRSIEGTIVIVKPIISIVSPRAASLGLISGACPEFDGFMLLPNKDHRGDNITRAGNLTEAASSCMANSNCRAFNTDRWLKAKEEVTDTAFRTNVPCSGLYVRAASACQEFYGFKFLANKDNDHNYGQATYPKVLSSVASQCAQDMNCRAFNTGGSLKLTPSVTRNDFGMGAQCAGMYIRTDPDSLLTGCEKFNGYTFLKNMNHDGDDIPDDTEWEIIYQVLEACTADPKCRAFNTDMQMKTKTSVTDPNFMMGFPCDGMYVKTDINLDCPQFDGFMLMVGKDHQGDDIGKARSLAEAASNCTSDTTCNAFNTEFAYKSFGNVNSNISTSKNKCAGIYARVTGGGDPTAGCTKLYGYTYGTNAEKPCNAYKDPDITGCPMFEGFMLLQGKSHQGDNIIKMKSLSEAAAKCIENCECKAFSTEFELKSKDTVASGSVGGRCGGLYVRSSKTSVCPVNTPGTPGTFLSFALSIPPLFGSSALNASLMLVDGLGNRSSSYTIEWQGNVKPAENIELSGASLVIQRDGGGMVLSTSGSIASIPVSMKVTLADKVARARGAANWSIAATARDIFPIKLLKTYAPSTPSYITKLIEPVSVSELTVEYDSTVGLKAFKFATNSLDTDLTMDRAGIVYGKLGVEGTYDIGTAFTTLLGPAAKLPVDLDDMLVLSDITMMFVSNRSTQAKPGTYLSFGLSVPPLLGGTVVTAQGLILDATGKLAKELTITWTGSFSPIRHVTLLGASLMIVKGVGAIVTADGTFVDITVSVNATIADQAARARGNPALSLTATAKNARIASTLETLYPDTPSFILDMVDGLTVKNLMVVYNSNAGFQAMQAAASLDGLGISLNVTLDKKGIVTGAFSLGAKFTLDSIIKKVAPFAVKDLLQGVDVSKLLVIKNPSLAYISSRAPQSAGSPGTIASFDLNIPAFMDAKSYFKIRTPLLDKDGKAPALFNISWTESYRINIWSSLYVTFTGGALTLTKGVGLSISTMARVSNLPMSISGSISSHYFVLEGTVYNITAADIIYPLWHDGIPGVPKAVLNKFRLLKVSVGFGSVFSFSALPDFEGLVSLLPGLEKVANLLGLSSKDINVTSDYDSGGVAMCLAKSWNVTLPSPFYGPTTIEMTGQLAASGASGMNWTVGGSAKGKMKIPILDPQIIDVGFQASVTYTASYGSTGTVSKPGFSFTVGAEATPSNGKPITIKGVNWISLQRFWGTVTFTETLAVIGAGLRAVGTVFGKDVDITYYWDKIDYAFDLSYPKLSLKDLLRALGVNIDLGPLKMPSTNVYISSAPKKMTIGGKTIEQGLRMKGKYTMLGFTFSTTATISTNGIRMSADLDTSQLTDALGEALELVADACGSFLDLVGLPSDAADIPVAALGLDVEITTSQQRLSFAVELEFLGVDLDFSVDVDITTDIWEDFVGGIKDVLWDTVTDKFDFWDR